MIEIDLKEREASPQTSMPLMERLTGLIILVTSLALLSASILSFYLLWNRTWPVSKWPQLRFYEAFGLTLLAIPVGFLAARQAIKGLFQPQGKAEGDFLAKTWVIFLATGWAAYIFVSYKFILATFIILWGSFALPMNAALLFRKPLAAFFKRHRIFWLTWALLFNLAFGLIAIEVGLHVTRYFSNNIVFLDEELDEEDYIERQRLEPGTPIFDISVDKRGFSDVLKPRKKGDILISAVGGSFNVLAAPHPYHFTSIAENHLPGVQIYCQGIRGIWLIHYPILIRKDVVPLNPDAILLTLFVTGLLPEQKKTHYKHPILREWFTFSRSMIVNTIPRIITLFKLKFERDRKQKLESKNQAPQSSEQKKPKGNEGKPLSLKTIFGFNPWLLNPLLEKPWMTKDAYLKLETRRALSSCQVGHYIYDWLRPLLLDIKKAAGGIPVFAVVIPDEFQVEDSLWEEVQKRLPKDRKFRRFYPQERIHAALKELGIPYVDCLKALRSGSPYRDGKLHYYLARNTHINIRGARVVGKLLTKFLRKQLHLKPKKKKRKG